MRNQNTNRQQVKLTSDQAYFLAGVLRILSARTDEMEGKKQEFQDRLLRHQGGRLDLPDDEAIFLYIAADAALRSAPPGRAWNRQWAAIKRRLRVDDVRCTVVKGGEWN